MYKKKTLINKQIHKYEKFRSLGARLCANSAKDPTCCASKVFPKKRDTTLRKSMGHVGKTRSEEMTTTETSKEIKMEGRRGHGRRAGTQLT